MSLRAIDTLLFSALFSARYARQESIEIEAAEMPLPPRILRDLPPTQGYGGHVI